MRNLLTSSLVAASLLVGDKQKWLSTTGFLDKVDENLQKAMS